MHSLAPTRKILYKLKLNEAISTVPTIGFNVEHLRYKNLDLTVWDVGGQDRIRSLWRHYFSGTDALIFVVDSCDRMRTEEAKKELSKLLANTTIAAGGVLPNIHSVLLPKKSKKSE